MSDEAAALSQFLAGERDRYRVRLILRNGARVPVSRTFLPKLRAEGWL